MRKKVLTIIPLCVLFIISVVFITIAIVVFTNKNHATLVKANSLNTEFMSTQFVDEYENSYDCQMVAKDKNNNFIIKAGGKIVITPKNMKAIGFNGLNIAFQIKTKDSIMLVDPIIDGKLTKYKLNYDDISLIIIDNQYGENINIGYIKLWF